ncbi:tRNA (guanosine(37)-N1)-methyltransferase TrmD [Tistrella mobilis]|uniref:tRNA (guanosine(37)-N1)-methyltransferase TrmD n=1 Tax=Tistrella mobilis TaxID=171437 RepID=UPI0035567836
MSGPAAEIPADEGEVAGTGVPWSAEILTLYPEMFPGPLGHSLAGRALDRGLWTLGVTQLRDYGLGRHRAVDDTPSGGGPGMVMRADVLAPAIDAAIEKCPGHALIYLTPRGQPLTQSRIRRLAAGPGVIVLCGRFEGVDQRLLDARPFEEICLGDFILSGGELAALVMIDACVRLLPGVMGAHASQAEESFEDDLLEYPHYTRPDVWEGRAVPEVLTSGHHERIRAWRQDRAEAVTRERRPDLWARREARRRGSGGGT